MCRIEGTKCVDANLGETIHFGTIEKIAQTVVARNSSNIFILWPYELWYCDSYVRDKFAQQSLPGKLLGGVWFAKNIVPNHFGVAYDFRQNFIREAERKREVEAGSFVNQWAAILAVLYDSYPLMQVNLS